MLSKYYNIDESCYTSDGLFSLKETVTVDEGRKNDTYGKIKNTRSDEMGLNKAIEGADDFSNAEDKRYFKIDTLDNHDFKKSAKSSIKESRVYFEMNEEEHYTEEDDFTTVPAYNSEFDQFSEDEDGRKLDYTVMDKNISVDDLVEESFTGWSDLF